MFSKSNITWILGIIVGVLISVPIFHITHNCKKMEVVQEHTFIDTITVIKYDTIIDNAPILVKKEIRDTIYIAYSDTIYIPLPIEKYRFRKEGIYDITATGYEVSLSSVVVFPKTICKTVTVEKEKIVDRTTNSLFVNAGFLAYNERFYPEVGISLPLRQKWLISANIGVLDNKPILGCSVGYNILNR